MKFFYFLVSEMNFIFELIFVDFCVLQFIVGLNGVCGLNYEYIIVEGLFIIFIVDYVLDYWLVFLIYKNMCIIIVFIVIIVLYLIVEYNVKFRFFKLDQKV